ncbi:MAG: PhzF family phenazine biosynthesis protein [Armatimonadetes bacterium]|nr:PhzF family phenazine biosynthesis protein [Armatimonadota bacterium]
MRCPFFLVDAFVAGPFTGNPAGVCLLEAGPDPEWAARVAAEVKQAETAFCWPIGDRWGLRWFTPTVEVDLCGHATLATAHALYESGRLADADAVFETKSGTLTCRPVGGAIEMDFPSAPPSACPSPDGLAEALGTDWTWCGENGTDWFVEVGDTACLRGLWPDMAKVERLGKRGVTVTAVGDGTACDFESRFFAPQSGIPEDDATGSAHCALAPYWAERLGRNPLTGHQRSARGAVIQVEVRDGRTALRGAAVTSLRGEWLL